MTRVGPGVSLVAVRTPTLPPATHTNAVLLGERRVTVIDPASPWPEEQEALFVALAGLELAAILLTHHHQDHVGGVEDLRARTGAPVVAHRETAARLPFSVDIFIDEGAPWSTDAGDWRVLHTPGHAAGHLCLERDGVVVAGDMVAGEGTIVLDPPEGDLGLYLGALERLRALGPRTLIPAHGPALTDAVGTLSTYIAHRHMRSEQARAALAALGPAPPEALLDTIYPSLHPFMRPVATRQILCHLRWLCVQGEAAEIGEELFVRT